MTWGRLNHPSELLKVGQELEVIVLDINKEKERVSLGLKQMQRNPWEETEGRFPVGARVADQTMGWKALCTKDFCAIGLQIYGRY